MKDKATVPLYTIGIASSLLAVCPATLRIWEKRGLISPARIGKNRFYSQCDMERLEYIKDLLQNKKVNIQGVKNIINTVRCWEIKRCGAKERSACPIYLGHR